MGYEEASEQIQLTAEQEAQLKEIAVRRSQDALLRLADGQGDEEAFQHLPQAAAAAFHAQDYERARQLAERALSLAPRFPKNWNYGNALHLGHTVLGLLAAQSGDVQVAVAELARSAETPGSPQLNTFGPTMQLAKVLLRVGQVDPVLEYLARLRAFWEMCGPWLDIWDAKIRNGQIPNCFQHSYV